MMRQRKVRGRALAIPNQIGYNLCGSSFSKRVPLVYRLFIKGQPGADVENEWLPCKEETEHSIEEIMEGNK